MMQSTLEKEAKKEITMMAEASVIYARSIAN